MNLLKPPLRVKRRYPWSERGTDVVDQSPISHLIEVLLSGQLG